MLRIGVVFAAAASLVAAHGAALAQEVGPSGNGAGIEAELERIREVTRKFHDIEAAHAAGFPTTVPGCLENPPAGGMGHHYVHPDRMDDVLEVERPEILVYRPTESGKLELAGVEYVVPYSAWPRDEPPRILGQNLKRSDGLRIWYLHVWVWTENVNGVFADWNPAVHCDGG